MANKTKKAKEEVVEAVEATENNVQISIEQICAAIIKTLGSVEIALEDLVADYSSKSIAVNQDEETKALTFTLSDTPVPDSSEEADIKTE
jgi:hypothetical protein